MLRYQFIGQSEDKVKRGPDATTGGLSYDRGKLLESLRRYDGGLTESLYNARRRVVGLFGLCCDDATPCCRNIVETKRKIYIAPGHYRC